MFVGIVWEEIGDYLKGFQSVCKLSVAFETMGRIYESSCSERFGFTSACLGNIRNDWLAMDKL